VRYDLNCVESAIELELTTEYYKGNKFVVNINIIGFISDVITYA